MKKNVSSDKSQSIVKIGNGSFSPQIWMEKFRLRQLEDLSRQFILCLEFYRSQTFYSLDQEERCTINSFVENFLYFFCHRDFTIPEQHLETYVHLQSIITNIVAISDFETTTPWVIGLVTRKENYFKVLTLLNPRVNFEIDQKLLFEISDYFTSQWWSFFWVSVVSYCRKDTYERIRRHLHNIDERFVLFNINARASYFPATYVAPEADYIVKRKLNELTKKTLSNVEIHNVPDKKKIAIISGRWYRSAVYTSLAPMIHSLKGHYEMTLIHLGHREEEPKDLDMFENVIDISMSKNQMDLSSIQTNSFNVVIFPDIGMNSESVFLSNIRLAPIQIVMYGHPASTHGSCIDYFMVGKKSEDLSRAAVNYCERLVVLPGMGLFPVFPDFPSPATSETAVTEPLLINCPWTSQKVTWPLIDALIDILRRTKRKIQFQFFSGGGLKGNNAFIPFAKDIWNLLGQENVKIFPPVVNEMYLSEMQKGAFSLDSYPFGGFNTIIDSLHLKKPVITWKGDFAYCRFAAATLELIGVPELIANSRDEFIELTLQMIHDDSFRTDICKKIASINTPGKFAESENPAYFKKAIDYLITNQDRLKNDTDRSPIMIE